MHWGIAYNNYVCAICSCHTNKIAKSMVYALQYIQVRNDLPRRDIRYNMHIYMYLNSQYIVYRIYTHSCANFKLGRTDYYNVHIN